jgi:hypothetical protein
MERENERKLLREQDRVMKNLHQKAINITHLELERQREARKREEEQEKKRMETQRRRELKQKEENDRLEERLKSLEYKCKYSVFIKSMAILLYSIKSYKI